MRNKRLLHETLRHRLPHGAVNRPKQGFTLPFATWMGGELQPFVRDGIAYLEDQQWIARGAGVAVWDAWTRGAAHWSRPWALGVLGQFLTQS
jgi:asparagine synthase (glutamine-hydrolysing)